MKTTSHVSKAQSKVVSAGQKSSVVHVKGHTRDAKGGGTYNVKGYDKHIAAKKELEDLYKKHNNYPHDKGIKKNEMWARHMDAWQAKHGLSAEESTRMITEQKILADFGNMSSTESRFSNQVKEIRAAEVGGRVSKKHFKEALKAQKSTKAKTPISEEARIARNRKARERHWQKTGVSDKTIGWMKDRGML